MYDREAVKPEQGRSTAARAVAGPAVQAAAAVGALRAGRVPAPDALTELQRAAGNAAVAASMEDIDGSLVHGVVSAGGQPLDLPVQQAMEAHLGHDLSSVRVHTDAQAARSAEAINAHAYTSGDHIVFQQGQYQPGTSSGLHMLAHELTHVVQQRSGPVSGSAVSGGVSVSDPSDAFEQAAERTADTVMRSLGGAGGVDALHADDEPYD